MSEALFQTAIRSLIYDFNHDRVIGSLNTYKAGGNLSIHRNRQVEEWFKNTDWPWWFSVDSDIALEDDTLYRLLEVADPDERPIVNGWYWQFAADPDRGPGWVAPAYYLKRFPSGQKKFAPIWYSDDDWPRDELLKVDGSGMGCTLVHRSVFERLLDKHDWPEPWFAIRQWDNVVYSEDLTFYRRCMELDIPVYLHSGVQVGHYKEQLVTSETLGVA